MSPVSEAFERDVATLWAAFDALAPDEFVARMESLCATLASDDAVGRFERGSAQDSTGHTDAAVVHYRAALAAGLDGARRRRATIQLASSLRQLGDAPASVALLRAEIDASADELDGAVRGFLALALVDVGREREAVAVALTSLAATLPRYQRSLARYAAQIAPAGAPAA